MTRKAGSGLTLAAIQRTIERSVAAAIAAEVPKAMHSEFLKLGLPTEGENNQIEAQKDFQFMRKARKGSEAAEGIIGKTAIRWIFALFGAVVLIGLGALARGELHNPIVINP